MNPLMISVLKACERWSIGKSKLYQLVASGQIEAVKFGVKTLLVVASGDEFFRSLPPYSNGNARKTK